MELQLFGINHKTAKLSDREMFIINDSNQTLTWQTLTENKIYAHIFGNFALPIFFAYASQNFLEKQSHVNEAKAQEHNEEYRKASLERCMAPSME